MHVKRRIYIWSRNERTHLQKSWLLMGEEKGCGWVVFQNQRRKRIDRLERWHNGNLAIRKGNCAISLLMIDGIGILFKRSDSSWVDNIRIPSRTCPNCTLTPPTKALPPKHLRPPLGNQSVHFRLRKHITDLTIYSSAPVISEHVCDNSLTIRFASFEQKP